MRRFCTVINASLTEILIIALAISAGIIGVQVWILMGMRIRTSAYDILMLILTIGSLASYNVAYFLHEEEG
jgi:hypothetical protein